MGIIKNNMRYFTKSLLATVCLLFCIHISAFAEDSLSANTLNKDKWEKISSGLDYTKEQEQSRPEPPPEKGEDPPEDSGSGTSVNLGGGAAFLKPLFFIIVIGVLAFVLMKIIQALMKRNASVDISRKVDIEQELEEENIEEWPLQQLLSKYQNEGDIRNSIRVYYLMALQLMHLNGFIKWEKDKTNSKYVMEYAAQKDPADFSNLTLLYETTWYGQFIPDENMFRIAQQQFSMFNAQFRKPNEK